MNGKVCQESPDLTDSTPSFSKVDHGQGALGETRHVALTDYLPCQETLWVGGYVNCSLLIAI